MIHGELDNYIRAGMAERLFAYAKEPKEFWLVPGAANITGHCMSAATNIAAVSWIFRVAFG